MADAATVARHRAIWSVRPELREVYEGWFHRLLGEVEALEPRVEIGSGPGFFKGFAPRLVATDALLDPSIDVCCDAGTLPFATGAVGALLLVDVLHHLPRPLDFLDEAARVLRPGGRLAMMEPWITPASYVLYRYLHHEACVTDVDIRRPFDETSKLLFDGNPAIPTLVLRRLGGSRCPLRVRTVEPVMALDHVASLGFKVARSLPSGLVRGARAVERLARPLRGLFATRAFIVLERVLCD